MISRATSVFSQVLTLKPMRCKSGAKESITRDIWAVLAVARRIPTLNHCLAVDLTAKFLVDAEGCPAVLSIRVDKGDLERIGAPAWLGSERGLLTGSAEHNRYALAPLLCGGST